jgi:type II secretory pathway component PulF
MESYKFVAIDQSGKIQRGSLLAKSEDEVRDYLLTLSWTPIRLRRNKEWFIYKFLSGVWGHLSLNDKIFLVRNLFIISKSGMNFKDGILLLLREAKPGPMKNFLLFLNFQLEAGSPLNESFASFPSYFTSIEVEMIKVGELSGRLTSVFERWAIDLEKYKQSRSEVISSLAYPSIILLAALGVIVVIVTFVLPKIAFLVDQLGQDVPRASRIILNSGIFIGAHIKTIGLGIFIFILLLFIFISSRRGQRLVIALLIRTPIVKTLLLATSLKNFAFFLGSLLNAGVSLDDSLTLVADSIFHPELKKAVQQIGADITQGIDFGESILRQAIFPKTFSGIVAISSNTGNVVEILSLLERYYEEDSRMLMKRLTGLIEPLLLVFIGLVVGGIALAVIVPIYQQIATQLGGAGGGAAP